MNMFIAIPEHHMSSGVHQTIGSCDIYDTDLTGHKRQVRIWKLQNVSNERASVAYEHKTINLFKSKGTFKVFEIFSTQLSATIDF